MKRHLIAIAILLLFGLARAPFEHTLMERQRKAFFHGATLSLELREQVGQAAFIAALSGFRSIVADALWIKAHTEWERTQWGQMALTLEQVTALQPRSVMFWDMAGWHMAWNASVAARNNPKQPRESLRIKAEREYFRLGEMFFLRGVDNNPDRHQLYEATARFYRDKMADHCKAAHYFDKAKDFPSAPSYVKRFAAYEMAACPGREREAYERLAALYHLSESEHLPTLLRLIRELQEKLDIPVEQRIKVPHDLALPPQPPSNP